MGFTTAAMPDRRGGWLFLDLLKFGGPLLGGCSIAIANIHAAKSPFPMSSQNQCRDNHAFPHR